MHRCVCVEAANGVQFNVSEKLRNHENRCKAIVAVQLFGYQHTAITVRGTFAHTK